ncbi:prenyltransferase/squalene oxidase repeat-containing protein [Jatrophihabitans endophyticus]|uniref:prenyltransferase/squalene oxidase repeat-containing protein n=1 Tax=Jatrophihabitans endophyticus TaxID=1206085 RepID=UPI001A0AEA47|nr:prenyltransferase/squalene oxidase repeat-containing protein [Jatrophihabitans endophyticus]MBE7186828.1 terpene cyclase/mutase family protein [Jatrophihabitans endophyticus]
MTSKLHTAVAVGAGIAAVALTSGLVAAPSVAAPATTTATAAPTTTSRYQAAAGWLTTQFVNGGYLPVPSGNFFVEDVYQGTTYVNYGENDDVLFALAAAKAGAAKAAVASAYLKKHVEDYADTDGTNFGPYDGSIGKLAVGAEVEGGNGTDFGGVNLLAKLKADECPATGTSCTPGEAENIYSSISESLVLIAEARAGGTYAPSAAAQAYFATLQCASGGFTDDPSAACGTGTADVDSTSYAIMAMQAMGITGPELDDAVSWLQGQQNSAGYWTAQNIPNVNSTGLAVSALQGVGAKYFDGRAWLRTQQLGRGRAGGALKYAGKFTPSTTSATSPSVLATAQGVSGLVDGSTLATVTATGSAAGVTYFAPTIHAAGTEKLGKTYSVYGGGYAAGEKVRIVRRGVTIATVTVSPSGQYTHQVTIAKGATPQKAVYTVTGLTSGLSAERHVELVA